MIVIPCAEPEVLLESIKDKVTRGVIRSWICDKDGDFTISLEQWNKKAWLRPSCESERLILCILPPEGAHISKLLYAVYHSRFAEMVLHRFDEEVSGEVGITPLPEGDDVVG